MAKTWNDIKDYNSGMKDRFEQINLIHDSRRCYMNWTARYIWDMPMRPHSNTDTITPTEAAVLLCLWRRSDGKKLDGIASVGSRWGAEQSCIDRKTWLRAVASLEKKKFIKQKEQKALSKRPDRSIYIIRYENLKNIISTWGKQCDIWETNIEKFNPDGPAMVPSTVAQCHHG